MAMRMLLDRIAGRNAQQGTVIEPDLILRATTPADAVQPDISAERERARSRSEAS